MTQKANKKKVLIRTATAGVHVGELVKREGADKMTVTLRNAHRVWRWRGAYTLHELALNGAAQDYTRISAGVPEITVLATEVIVCSPAAYSNLTEPRWSA